MRIGFAQALGPTGLFRSQERSARHNGAVRKSHIRVRTRVYVLKKLWVGRIQGTRVRRDDDPAGERSIRIKVGVVNGISKSWKPKKI